MLKLHGVIPPVVTPLTADGAVDFPSLTRVLEHLLAGGVHALFVLGSTSEVVFHTADTRRRIIAHAMEVVRGRVPVVAGVVDPTTDRVVEHVRHAEAEGAQGLVVTAPFYARTSAPEVIDHFRYVRDATALPIIAYDLPVSVHFKLDRATVVTLAREGTIAALKDSSGDDAGMRYILSDLADKPEVSVMTGSELTVDAALAFGAHGVVPGLGNVDPAGYVRLWDAVQRGDFPAARKEQDRLCRLFEIVWLGIPRTSMGSSGVGGFKTAMRRLGIIETNTMARPQRALNATEAARVDEIMRGVGLIE